MAISLMPAPIPVKTMAYFGLTAWLTEGKTIAVARLIVRQASATQPELQ